MSSKLSRMDFATTVLCCYLIWYLGVVYLYFDATRSIWLNSLGISAIIGFALFLSVGGTKQFWSWQTARLFAMPFCVSSFSALIKGRGFVLIFPSNTQHLKLLVGACVLFVLVVQIRKRF